MLIFSDRAKPKKNGTVVRSNAYIVPRAVKPWQKHHQESQGSFVGWGGTIFVSSTQVSASALEALSRK